MYVLILLLVPFLYLFNPYLAMAGLIVAIVVMYVDRTGGSKKRRPKHEPESEYTPGYEN
jgi:hypothetical protein